MITITPDPPEDSPLLLKPLPLSPVDERNNFLRTRTQSLPVRCSSASYEKRLRRDSKHHSYAVDPYRKLQVALLEMGFAREKVNSFMFTIPPETSTSEALQKLFLKDESRDDFEHFIKNNEPTDQKELKRKAADACKRLTRIATKLRTESLSTVEITLSNEPTCECGVCFEERLLSDIQESPCGHIFCKECLYQNYRTKILDGSVSLTCTEYKCTRKISEDELMSIIGEEQELCQKFVRFKYYAAVSQNPNCRWCPSPDCDTAMLGDPSQSVLTCSQCSTSICFRCSMPWHEGKLCSDVVDERYKKFVRDKDVRPCPMCQMPIEKNGGCNHIICTRCKHHFCWLCNREYNPDHYAEWNVLGCPGGRYGSKSVSSVQKFICCILSLVCCPCTFCCCLNH
eukprot:759295_1